MPVVAVLAAVVVDAGVLAGGLAAITTLEAITAIGATLGAIGAVTHNKTLSYVGMGLGIVGGLGTLASNAGLFGASSATTAADTAAGAEAFSGTSADTFADAAQTAAGAEAFSGTGAGLATATGDLNATALDPVGAINATSLAPAEGNAASIVTGGQEGGALAQSLSPSTGQSILNGGAGTDAVGAAPSAGTAAADFSGATTPTAKELASAMKIFDSPTDGSPGMFGRLMNWGKSNPMLAYGIVQAGGSFISGLTNPVTPAQINALNAQADANRAAASLLQRQQVNVAQPLPTVSGAPMTSAPVTGTPSGGLINNRPAAAPLITGMPASTPLLNGASA